jgi:hypothetical protein
VPSSTIAEREESKSLSNKKRVKLDFMEPIV